MSTKNWLLISLALIAVLYLASAGQTVLAAGTQAVDRKAEPEAAAADAKQQLAARDSALAAKDQQLNMLNGTFTKQALELERARKELAVNRDSQKKIQGERAKKTLKIYKSLRPEEAAKLIDKLDENTAAELINALDQKTVATLIPYLNQQRVLKWTRETMAGK